MYDRKAARPTLAISVLVVWALLQIPRLIAIPIISDVLTGIDSTAWLFPAIGDIVIATTAPFIAFALWRNTGLGVWVASLIWLALSIFDHMSTIAAALTTTAPRIFTEMGSADSSATVPFVQAIVDAALFVLLTRPNMRAYFLETK